MSLLASSLLEVPAHVQSTIVPRFRCQRVVKCVPGPHGQAEIIPFPRWQDPFLLPPRNCVFWEFSPKALPGEHSGCLGWSGDKGVTATQGWDNPWWPLVRAEATTLMPKHRLAAAPLEWGSPERPPCLHVWGAPHAPLQLCVCDAPQRCTHMSIHADRGAAGPCTMWECVMGHVCVCKYMCVCV